MTYTLTTGSSVTRDADGAIIPADPNNSDFQTYQAWLGAGNTPSPVPVPALASAISTAIAGVLAYANGITALITNAYPQSEVDSWPAQLAEARIVVAGGIPPAPSLLQAMVALQNNPSLTLQSLAAAVIANATAYQIIVANVQAVRISAQTQLNAVTNPTQITPILAALQAQANALAVALGV